MTKRKPPNILKDAFGFSAPGSRPYPVLGETEIADYTHNFLPVTAMVSSYPYSGASDSYHSRPFITHPEKILFLEVLKRAREDLRQHIEREFRISAIYWFECGFQNKKLPDVAISFLDCVEVLDLGINEIVNLKKLVEEANAYEARFEPVRNESPEEQAQALNQQSS